jgi:hypothetical protein
LSTRDWSSLEDVALAVSVASEYETEVFVERLGARYRWSLIHSGGPYPLLRITARFLQVDYHRIFIACREIAGGYSALCDTPEEVYVPDASQVLSLLPHASHDAVESLIREILG